MQRSSPINSDIFWNETLSCPIVYIAGSCARSNNSKGKAWYGICWGHDDVKNASGPVRGAQNELRAELTALKKTLEIALSENIMELVIASPSAKMVAELEPIEQGQDKWRNSSNQDILLEIDKLFIMANDRKYYMDDVPSFPDPRSNGYSQALHFATNQTNNSMKAPIRKGWNVPTVAIFGACAREGQTNPMASFGVFWGEQNDKNKYGTVDGRQTSLRGGLCALRDVLETATSKGLSGLHVLTANSDIANLIEKITSGNPIDNTVGKTNSELVAACSCLAKNISKLTVKHIPAVEECPALNEARDIAKSFKANTSKVSLQFDEFDECLDNALIEITDRMNLENSKLKPTKQYPTVVILGMCMGRKQTNLKATYAVYWGEGNNRNESGIVEGVQTSFSAVLYAARVALETAHLDDVPEVHLLTRSRKFQSWFNKLKRKSHDEGTSDVNNTMELECQTAARKLQKVTVDILTPERHDIIYKQAMQFAGVESLDESKDEIEILSGTVMRRCDNSINYDAVADETTDFSVSKISEQNAFELYTTEEIPVVYVGGACRGRGHSNAIAVYSIFWATAVSGSSQGPVSGVVNKIRAKLMAVKIALEQAAKSGIYSLMIKTDDQMVFDTLNHQNSPIGNKDLMSDIDSFIARMNYVAVEMASDDDSSTNILADNLAEMIIDNLL